MGDKPRIDVVLFTFKPDLVVRTVALGVGAVALLDKNQLLSTSQNGSVGHI